MPLTEMLTELARGALALLIAALAIYLSLKLLGKIAKFVIIVIIIAVVLYFIFTTDVAQQIKDAVSSLSLWQPFWRKGA